MVSAATITAQARQVRFWPFVLSLIATVLIGLGRLTYRLFAFSWLACAWSWCAIRQGWREAKAADAAKRLAARQAAGLR